MLSTTMLFSCALKSDTDHFLGQALNMAQVLSGWCCSLSRVTFTCTVENTRSWKADLHQVTTLLSVSMPRFRLRSGYLVRTGSLCSNRFSPPSLYDSTSYSTVNPLTDWKRLSLSLPTPKNPTLK